MPSSNRRQIVAIGGVSRGYVFRGPYFDDGASRMDAESLSGSVCELLPPPNARDDLLTVFACLLDTLGLKSFDDERLSLLQDLGLTPTEVGKYMLMATEIHRESRRT